MGREAEDHEAGPGVEGAGAAGPALKPRERSSGAARIAEEEVVAQSAKAPESEGNCRLVVATTDCFDS